MKEYSSRFCIYPWIHQQASPNGLVKLCCVAQHKGFSDDEGQFINLGEKGFEKAWNTDLIRKIRAKMVRGESVSECKNCYLQEEMGKKSYRQSCNQEWSHRLGERQAEEIVDRSIANNFYVDQTPAYLDLRLGNLCNLKCRTCNPNNSVQIQKEWLTLDKESQGNYTEFWRERGFQYTPCDPWYESENFWSSVEGCIPNLKKVYMTGGEPTLIEGNYKFLKKCREMGFADQIELFFNINLTHLRESFVNEISHFRKVQINCSLDGYTSVNEYIRPPSRWNVCEENFKTLAFKTDRQINLGVTPVIQIYNIYDIVPLLDFVESVESKSEKEILIDFLFCFNPSFLDVAHLPPLIKNKALERLEDFKQRSLSYFRGSYESSFLKNGIDSLIQRLTKNDEDNEKILDFIKYTKTLDQSRGQSFSEQFPELYKDFLISGYKFEEVSVIQ